MVGRQARTRRFIGGRSASAPASRRIATSSSMSRPATARPGIEVGAARDMTFNRHVSATRPRVVHRAAGHDQRRARSERRQLAAIPSTDPVPGTYSAGNVASISIIPRWRLAGYFVIDGQYTLTNIGADQYVPGRTTVASNAPLGNAAATTQAARIRLLIFDDRHQQSRTATAAVRGVVQPSRDAHRERRARYQNVSGSGDAEGVFRQVRAPLSES